MARPSFGESKNHQKSNLHSKKHKTQFLFKKEFIHFAHDSKPSTWDFHLGPPGVLTDYPLTPEDLPGDFGTFLLMQHVRENSSCSFGLFDETYDAF